MVLVWAHGFRTDNNVIFIITVIIVVRAPKRFTRSLYSSGTVRVNNLHVNLTAGEMVGGRAGGGSSGDRRGRGGSGRGRALDTDSAVKSPRSKYSQRRGRRRVQPSCARPSRVLPATSARVIDSITPHRCRVSSAYFRAVYTIRYDIMTVIIMLLCRPPCA